MKFIIKKLVVMFMLTSLLGQAFAMSFNPAVIAHELDHLELSSAIEASPALELTLFGSSENAHHDDHDHDGEFDNTVHQLLHAAHHVQLFAAPNFAFLQLVAETSATYEIYSFPFIQSSIEPLFRPPRLSFAS